MPCFFSQIYTPFYGAFLFSLDLIRTRGRAPAGQNRQCVSKAKQCCLVQTKPHWNDTHKKNDSVSRKSLNLFLSNHSSLYLSRLDLSPEICCGISAAAPHSSLMSDVCNECLDGRDRMAEQPVSLDALHRPHRELTALMLSALRDLTCSQHFHTASHTFSDAHVSFC